MKTKTIWLAALALLAILFISGTVFAEGEVPEGPSAEVPQAPAAEEPPVVPDEPAAAVETAPPPVVQETPVEPAAIVEEAPPPAEPEAEAPAVESPAVVEEPVVVEAPIVAEAPLVEVVPAAEEPVAAELAPELVGADLPAEEALPAVEELPVVFEEPVLVDAAGEPLVLATEEAVEILAAPDPYFTVTVDSVITTYSFTALDCNPDDPGNQPCSTVDCNSAIVGIQACVNPLAAAINYIDINAKDPDDGHLHVQAATYTGNITIDYIAKPNLSTITSLIGEPTAGLNPTISGSLSLLNLTNGFELLHFNITGGTLIQGDGQFIIDNVSTNLTMTDVNASGLNDTENLSPGDGITITNHKGNIVLHHVTSNKRDSGGSGLIIDQHLSGSVTIDQGSQFNENDSDGLNIISVGNVTLNTVTANGNADYGMHIQTPATVTLASVMASNNGLDGIVVYYQPVVPGGVNGSIVNINGAVAQDNSQSGIFVRSRGATLKNIAANGNAVTGLWVDILSGTTLLENVVANCNGTYDANCEIIEVDGSGDNLEVGVRIYAYVPTTGAVTLRNITAFNNEDGGIYSETFGPVTAFNISTNNTANGDGTYLTTNGAVNFTSLGAFENDGNGLYVRTKGAITITGIYASNNGLSGADLDNCLYNEGTSLCTGTGAIIVRNISGWMSDLSNNGHFGLWAVSKGAITVTNLNATNNGADGAILTNWFSGSTAGITVNTLGAVHNNFSSNGWNKDYDPTNDGDPANDYYMSLRNGLSALSVGNISVTNTDAWQNQYGGYGIYLDNADTLAIRTVGLTYSNTGENDLAGVWIESRGVITLINVSANNNWDVGIHVQNDFSGATAGVSLTNISADNNNNTGLEVLTKGSAILTNINTHNNVKRQGWISSGEMVQDFFNHYDWGDNPDMWWFEAANGTTYEIRLAADTFDSLNRVDFFPLIELYDSEDWETPLAITLGSCNDIFCSFTFSQTTYVDPHQYFLMVGSTENGTEFNGPSGFYRLSINDIDQTFPPNQMYWVSGTAITAGASITVRGINTSGNSLIGLGATTMTNGGITLSNLQVFNNGTEGVYLTCGQDPVVFDDSGWGTGTITLSGSNNINDNGWDGLIMATSGNVTLSSLEASRNGQPTGSRGISIRDDTVAKAVVLSGINAGENGATGLFINATGNVTLTNANFWNNFKGAGIDIANDFGPGTIRLTNVTSNDNQGIGIDLYSNGLITLSGVQANGNWGPGICLKNDYDLATAGITLSTVRAESNGDSGINAKTNGALLMSNINANSNAMTWGGIDNGTTIQNFYNTGKGPDHWWFEAVEGVEITLKLWADGSNDAGSEWLNRWDFDPFLQVFDEGGSEITFDPDDISFEYSNSPDPNWTSDDFYRIIWTPGTGESGRYYLEVSSDNGNSGFYRLSINDSDPADPERRWVDGLTYEAGGNVTLSGTNSFSDNEMAGLIGWSGGSVTLSNIFAWGNGTEGIYVDNTEGSSNVTLSGTNASGGNGWEGLRIFTDGAVSLSNLEANHNGQDGIRIAAFTAPKTVYLSNIAAMWNGLSGIDMKDDDGTGIEDTGGTHGITTLNNVRAWFNNTDGVKVDTNGYRLNLLNSSFICNNGYGFVYWYHENTLPMLPFVFSNVNNIFLGNGSSDLAQK